jgi:hypothetical protein
VHNEELSMRLMKTLKLNKPGEAGKEKTKPAKTMQQTLDELKELARQMKKTFDELDKLAKEVKSSQPFGQLLPNGTTVEWAEKITSHTAGLREKFETLLEELAT